MGPIQFLGVVSLDCLSIRAARELPHDGHDGDDHTTERRARVPVACTAIWPFYVDGYNPGQVSRLNF